MIANKHDKKMLIVFSVAQILISQLAIMLMKFYSFGTGKNFISFFTSLCFYVFVFIIPILCYLKYVDNINPLTYLKLNSNIVSGITKGILIGSFIFIFLLFKNRFHIIKHISFREDIFLILGKILVGPLEEIPFRGFYMQKLKKFIGFPIANLVSSMLFACMHVIVKTGGGVSLVYSLLYIMIIGLWMGYIFEKTKSLWCVSIVHSIYDISIWIL